MKDRITSGLVGYGMAGRVFHAPLLSACAGIDFAALATSQGDVVRAAYPDVAIYPDAAALFADPALDLVVLATPNASHAPLAEAALRAGKHVVIDKPFALSLAEAQRVVDVAQAHERSVFVFQNRRWDSCFQTVRDAIAQGLIGNVVQFESHFDRYRPEVRDRWREDGGPGSGLWVDVGPHMVDQVLLLFGLPQTVTASIAALRPGAICDDWAHVVLGYADKQVVLQASLLVAGAGFRFLVHGTKGTLLKPMLDQQEAQLIAGLRPGDEGWGADADALLVWDAAGTQTSHPALIGGQEQFYHQLAAHLQGQAEAPNSVAAMLAVQNVLDAALQSAHEGRTIAL